MRWVRDGLTKIDRQKDSEEDRAAAAVHEVKRLEICRYLGYLVRVRVLLHL